MRNNYEDQVTGYVAERLLRLQPEWENIEVRQCFPNTTKRPDMLVIMADGTMMPIEAKWDDSRDNVDDQVTKFIGMNYKVQVGDGEFFEASIDTAMAIRYPAAWRRLPLRNLLEAIDNGTVLLTCIKAVNGTIAHLNGDSPMPITVEQLAVHLQLLAPAPYIPDSTDGSEDLPEPDDFMSSDWLLQKLEERGTNYRELGEYLNNKSVYAWFYQGRPVPRQHYAKIREFIDAHPVQVEQVHIPSA